MDEPVKILHLEDEAVAAELCEHELRQSGLNFTIKRVTNRGALQEALRTFSPDLILSDYNLRSDIDGFAALDLAKQQVPQTPFVLVSGTVGEEHAVKAMKAGATDYVLKDRIERLGPVAKRALREAREKRERLAMEDALRQTEARFRLFMRHLPGRASIKDAEGRYTYVNERWAAAFGMTPDEVIGRRPEELWQGERAASLKAAHEKVVATGAGVTRVFRTGDKDDAHWWLSNQFPIPVEGTVDVGTIGLDITQQKEQEEKIARLSRVHAMLSGINAAIIHAHDEAQLFEAACRIAVEHGEFGIVWIGRLDPATGEVTPIATAGLEGSEFLRSTSLSVGGGRAQAGGVVGHAIRSKAPAMLNDIAAEASAGGERRKEAIRRGYRSVIALPFMIDGEVTAVFSLFSKETAGFDDGEVALLKGLAGNISFALGNMTRQRKLDKLSRIRAVSGAVNAAIVRVRDREALLRETCRIVVEHGQFEFVWTGLIDEERKAVRAVSWAGFSDETAMAVGKHLDSPRVSLNEVLRTRRPAVRNDVSGETGGESAGHLRIEAVSKGCRSSICLPFMVDDRIVAAIIIYATGRGFFDQDELALLNELKADISFAFQSIARQEQLQYLSYYDSLTGLPNRQLFLDRVSQQIRVLDAEARMVALVLFEIERFRAINETLGRDGADALLKEIASRSEATFGTKDVLARVAGDTFGVVVSGIRDAAEAVNIVEREVAGCFSRPFVINGNELRVAARAGIALFPADGVDADTLFGHAEAALKRAISGGERYLFYAPEMNAQVAQSILLETKLRAAVDAREFVLHYQPQIELAGGAVCGVEALIRWQDPQAGLVSPGAFIPLLEETGLILEAGSWALGQAMRDQRDWTARGLAVPRVAVNVSAIQLQQKDFVETVLRIVEDAGNEPKALEIEVTESLLMNDLESSIQKLSALRGHGVHIAMDDFGTGYSSLSNLSRLPLDLLKIDRSFVEGMANNSQDLAIVRTILALADALSLRVIAEGVETHEQAQLLRLLRCQEAQGYFYSRPLPGKAFEEFLASHRPAR